MKYMGSKSRISKYIVPIIQETIDSNNIDCYIEPFVGGANIIDKISCKEKIGSDKQECLISMYQNLDKINTLPSFVTKEHYSEVRESFNKNTSQFETYYKGYIGFLASYNGRFFDGGYAGVVITKTGVKRNYYDEAKRNLLNQIPSLQDIHWRVGDYRDLYKDVENRIFYCDIPYKGTKQYGINKNFDYDAFWEWAREKSEKNIVFISEENAPEDFKCIWEVPVKRTIDNNKRVKKIEKLFIYRENKIAGFYRRK